MEAVKDFEEADIKSIDIMLLLAYMCCRCSISKWMKMRRFSFPKEYACYIPEYDADLDVAKELFARKGIETHRYFITTNHFPGGTNSLCAKYSEVKNREYVKDFMWDIANNSKGNKRKWPQEQQDKFNKIILEIKQELNQKQK